ncbi:DUF3667 domain-containing protein [Flavobacterium orientale]|uniref:DUF3667 domain-containing protein n=1 Tax=Flavobacterium orientale TaxID=1756020 RepID=A0A916Y2B0_9FLAO|nr:DUF3667 domain-containing protein [Flavobacterium orientale]GGD27747.1 hypothetical protein GCM10011343_17400 [Flavobacterium orientale]
MHCKNCQNEFSTAVNYCSDCGGKVVVNRITIKQILADLSNSYLSLDNKFVVTFRTLFSNPSAVVNGYINGERGKYVNPISYFVLAIAMGGVFSLLMVRGYFGEIDYSQYGAANDKLDMKDVMAKVADYNNLIYLISLPIIALMSKIVFYNLKQYNYAEHLVIYGYTYSQCAIISFLAIPILLLVKPQINYYSIISILVYIVLHIYFLKRIFHLPAKKMVLKTLLFVPVLAFFYFAMSLVFVIVFFVYLYLTNQFPIP